MNNINYISQDEMATANKFYHDKNYEMALHFYSIVLNDASKYEGDDMSVIMYAASASDQYQACLKLLNNQKKLETEEEYKKNVSPANVNNQGKKNIMMILKSIFKKF